jgi:hypothetical protein
MLSFYQRKTGDAMDNVLEQKKLNKKIFKNLVA